MKKMKKNICKRMTQENKKENEYNHHTNCVTYDEEKNHTIKSEYTELLYNNLNKLV